MKILLLLSLAALSAARPQVYSPSSSYGVPSGARLAGGQIDSGFFPLPTANFAPFASGQFQAPIFGPSSFLDGASFRLQTESPASFNFSTVSPLGSLVTGNGLSGVVTSTVAPEVSSYAGFGDGFSTTAAPFFPSSSFAPEFAGFGVSTPAPYIAPGFGVNGGFDAVYNSADYNQGAVEKSLYFFTAPEDEETIQQRVNLPAQAPQRRYKIIFIKAPTYNTRRVIDVPPQVNEEKTLVYVLVKKPEENTDVHVQPQQTVPSRPEVFFVKYKTQREAEEAVAKINAGAQAASVTANPVGTADFINSIPHGGDSSTTVNGVNLGTTSTAAPFAYSQQFIPSTSTVSPAAGASFGGAFPVGASFGEFQGSTAAPALNLGGAFGYSAPASFGASFGDNFQSTTASPLNLGSFGYNLQSSTPAPVNFGYSAQNVGGSFGYPGFNSVYNFPQSFGGVAQGRSAVAFGGEEVTQPAAVVKSAGEATTEANVEDNSETVNIGGSSESSVGSAAESEQGSTEGHEVYGPPASEEEKK